jgi:tripartite-type tricarboxylate transporter receptor subunit TctC
MKETTYNRRSALEKMLGAGTLALTGGVSMASEAEAAFPSKPVKIIVPFPAGDTLDTSTRAVADGLSRKWGKPVVVENRPGASTLIGTAAAAQSPPDGHTLLSTVSLILQNQILRKSLPYDPQALAPVAQISLQQLVIVARAGSGIRSFEELRAAATAAPDKLKYGTIGLGSSTHIVLEAIARMRNLRLVHVPYKGGSEVMRALLSSDIDVALLTQAGVQAHVASGRLVPIAVTGPRRVQSHPTVPTLEELEIKGFNFFNWLALFSHARTPAAITNKIAQDVAEVLNERANKERYANEMLLTPPTISPADLARQMDAERRVWQDHIRTSAVAVE